jgi:hypothetical protein
MDTGNPVVYRLTVKRDGSRTVEWPVIPTEAITTRVADVLDHEAKQLGRMT